MRGVALITVGALVLALAAALGPAAIAGGKPKTGDEPGAISRADLVGVNFIENCRFSHQAPDDPIVFPSKPGASHQHTFVGNRTTSAFSNFGSLRSGPTTCMRRDDTAAYWVPTLYQGSTAVFPQGATIYYRRGTLAEVSAVPEQPADHRRRCHRDEPAGHARHVLELRDRERRGSLGDRPDVPGHARVVPAPAHPLP